MISRFGGSPPGDGFLVLLKLPDLQQAGHWELTGTYQLLD